MVQRPRIISTDFDGHAEEFIAEIRETVRKSRKRVEESFELMAKANELRQSDREWWLGK